MVIFLDTNIVIDYFSERPQSEIARQVMEKCVERNFPVCFSSTTVVNCFYIMRKEFSVPEIKDLFFNLFDFADIVGTSRENIIRSLENSSFSDFEDCVQSGCADEVNAARYACWQANVQYQQFFVIPVLRPDNLLFLQ